MNCRQFTALTSSHDVSKLATCNVERGNIILMEGVVWEVLVGILWFFVAAKEFLLSSFKILTNSKSSSCEDNLIIGLAEVNTVLVPVASETIDMVNFVGNIRLACVEGVPFWRLLNDLFQEELISLFFFRFCFIHVFLTKISFSKYLFDFINNNYSTNFYWK